MPKLSEKQIEIREKWIDDLAKMTSKSVCPCCNRGFEVGKEKAEQIATENNMALNALVAALCPGEA